MAVRLFATDYWDIGKEYNFLVIHADSVVLIFICCPRTIFNPYIDGRVQISNANEEF